MVAVNDITGDSIQSRGVSEAYRTNYDLVVGKKKQTKQEQPTKESSDGQETEARSGDN